MNQHQFDVESKKLITILTKNITIINSTHSLMTLITILIIESLLKWTNKINKSDKKCMKYDITYIYSGGRKDKLNNLEASDFLAA